MKSTILALLVVVLGSSAAFAQASESGQDKIAAVSSTKLQYPPGKDPKPESAPIVGTDGGKPVDPSAPDAQPETLPARVASSHMTNNLFEVNYRTLERGKDHDLKLKDGTKTGQAKWNEHGGFTIYDNEMTVQGQVVYGKRGSRYQVISDDGVVVKDSGSRGEKIVTYMVLIGIGIGVTVAAAGS